MSVYFIENNNLQGKNSASVVLIDDVGTEVLKNPVISTSIISFLIKVFEPCYYCRIIHIN